MIINASEQSSWYVSWCGYAATYDTEKRCFFLDLNDNKKAIKNVYVADIFAGEERIGDIWDYDKCNILPSYGKTPDGEGACIVVKYSSSNPKFKSICIGFTLRNNGIDLKINAPKEYRVNITADVSWGDGGCENTYPMSSKRTGNTIRCAVGPASTVKDNMLFDRLTDTAVKFTGPENFNLSYDWVRKTYAFKLATGLSPKNKKMHISYEKDILADMYGIDYAVINKNSTFTKPPIGWMTWYAVKFNASEEKVLKNAKWMSENLKEYGANSVWVDWEWYHKDFSGSRDDGADSFNPDKEKYPHGLKYVADKIKEMGLTPALWIGFTVDTAINEYIKDNPDIILADKKSWCGRYFFDFSHPKYLNEFLPKAIANVKSWGYEAFKYDCLPSAMTIHDRYHDKMYDPSLTTKEAYRKMIEVTRKEMGKDTYMLSCSGGTNDSNPLWAGDMFDAARIGEDVFEWKEFMTYGVDRVLRFYPLNNNLMYLDCDNIVMREEFNNEYQAASRIYFVSMLGLPITFGDEFDALDNKRVDLIKSCIPVLDIHPMDSFVNKRDGDIVKINLAIEKEWGSYNVLNVFNSKDAKNSDTVDLKKDLCLENGEYLVFDYTDDKFLGIKDSTFSLKLGAYASKILSIRKKQNIPQIISTSRHISQGAMEISDLIWTNDENTLTIKAEVIKDAPYKVTLFVPDEYTPISSMEKVEKGVYQITVTPKMTGEETIICKFKKA